MKYPEYYIYKYDFHQAPESSMFAESEGVDGAKYVKVAQDCFDSLFDERTIDNLTKQNNKGEHTRLHNDVIKKIGNIYIWRVNNSQMKEYCTLSGKDTYGVDKYENQEIESKPFCYVLIDNRPGCCLMAIEKSTAWQSNPDKLRDMLLKNFNKLLAAKFGLEMRIDARMNPSDVWGFIRERIYQHGDCVRKISFQFQNDKKINKSKSTAKVNSPNIKALKRISEETGALNAIYTMLFDENNKGNISPQNRDMAEMVNLCSQDGYDITITFKDFKVYRINDYIKASFGMSPDILQEFRIESRELNDKTRLENWFDLVAEQTKDYVNETQIPKRRHSTRK